MARIRSVKPEFFKHHELYMAEKESNLPLRLAFQGLWLIADREGRFKWKPQQIKLDALPYDEIDMSIVMETLLTGGFIKKYEVGGKVYGFIPSWEFHQKPTRDEPPSEIPAPDGNLTIYDRPPNQTIRIRIYERDNYTCLYCRDNLKEKPRSICLDHVVPYSKKGTNRELNLATCCKKCNSAKGDRTPEECGFMWPEGLGEIYENGEIHPVNPPLTPRQPTVNTPSTHRNDVILTRQHPPDKEGEREGKGKEQEGSRKGVAFNQKPVSTDFNGLPDMTLGSAKQLIQIIQKVSVSDKDILGMWDVFKVQCLTGQKHYPNEGEVYSHFINWIKDKKFTQTSTGVKLKFD